MKRKRHIGHADAIIIGGGISGMATAARLQVRGLRTRVLESHAYPGGCAGYFQKNGFTFDVGATTFVDFGPGGVGGQFLEEIGAGDLPGEILPAYRLWLPDRTVTLARDRNVWHRERLRAFGDTPAHRRFWRLLDRVASAFWTASRTGVKLPVRSLEDIRRVMCALPPRDWPLLRYASWTMGDALRLCGLDKDVPLRRFLGMLIQDTVHSTVEQAPLINSALGTSIRDAGLMRPLGGAKGFWDVLVRRYEELGGELHVGTRVERVDREDRGYVVHTRRGSMRGRQVVSTLPIWNTAQLGLPEVRRRLEPYLRRDKPSLGGAVVAFLGVEESEVADNEMTHHQLLASYDGPLNDGNNMFVSVSAPGDHHSAPLGCRTVMISTHCDLEGWEGLSRDAYAAEKQAIGRRLLARARRVYPELGRCPYVFEVGTPRTYARFTRRYRGAVGGVRLTLGNSNQRAVPYDHGIPGFWQAGDTTWPGLGTVACILGSGHVAEAVARRAKKRQFVSPKPPRSSGRELRDELPVGSA